MTRQKACDTLDIPNGATLPEIRSAYVDLVKVWHPDRFAHDPVLQKKAQDKLKEINEAYGVLEAAFDAEPVDPTATESAAADSVRKGARQYRGAMPPDATGASHPKAAANRPGEVRSAYTWGCVVIMCFIFVAVMIFAVSATVSDTQTLRTPTIRSRAENGEAHAQHYLGFMYANGQGVAQDRAEAVRWWRKAADQGHPDAQTDLGASYGTGQGVAQDHAEAVLWLRKAADQGSSVAQYNLGLMYANGQGVPQDYTEAVRWYGKAADQGYSHARRTLGSAYANGKGTKRDQVEAVRWYVKAADQGDADAQSVLGLMYRDGDGVPQDYTEAVRWWRKSAERGDDFSQRSLGMMYADGKGVPQDYVEAHKWLNLAASRATGNEQRTYSAVRESIANRMTPQQIIEAQRRAREWKPKTELDSSSTAVK